MIIIFFLGKKKKQQDYVVGLKLPYFKTYYKAAITKTLQYWCKKRHTDPWNRTESLEIDPCLYDQLIFNKVIKMRKRVFSTKGAGITEYP